MRTAMLRKISLAREMAVAETRRRFIQVYKRVKGSSRDERHLRFGTGSGFLSMFGVQGGEMEGPNTWHCRYTVKCRRRYGILVGVTANGGGMDGLNWRIQFLGVLQVSNSELLAVQRKNPASLRRNIQRRRIQLCDFHLIAALRSKSSD